MNRYAFTLWLLICMVSSDSLAQDFLRFEKRKNRTANYYVGDKISFWILAIELQLPDGYKISAQTMRDTIALIIVSQINITYQSGFYVSRLSLVGIDTEAHVHMTRLQYQKRFESDFFQY